MCSQLRSLAFPWLERHVLDTTVITAQSDWSQCSLSLLRGPPERLSEARPCIQEHPAHRLGLNVLTPPLQWSPLRPHFDVINKVGKCSLGADYVGETPSQALQEVIAHCSNTHLACFHGRRLRLTCGGRAGSGTQTWPTSVKMGHPD